MDDAARAGWSTASTEEHQEKGMGGIKIVAQEDEKVIDRSNKETGKLPRFLLILAHFWS